MLLAISALVLLTFCVALTVVTTRRNAVIRGEIPFSYYRVFRGAEPTDLVLKTTNNFKNLLETPTLFYVVCILAIVLKYETTLMMSLAWLYVLLRVVHSYIHLTYNNVIHRLYAFGSSLIVILIMFVVLVANRGFA